MENSGSQPNVIARLTQSAPFLFLADIKFEHSLFALPFAYLGLFLAEGGLPRLFLFAGVTVAMVSFRTFAMAMNRLIDREIDAKNPRTQCRALPQKKLSPHFVKTLSAVSLAIFLGTAWILGPLCFYLSPVPIFLAWIYPYLKRFTWLSHSVLGIILGISPNGAWLASRNEFSWIPGLLGIGVTAWVSGFDVLYALQDDEFDRSAGLKSIPVKFGRTRSLWIAGFLHALAVGAWAAAGKLAGLGWIYDGGIALVASFLFREHWLVHRFGLAKLEQAFFTMNACVSFLIFLSAAASLIWR